jgi:hypothetical protein
MVELQDGSFGLLWRLSLLENWGILMDLLFILFLVLFKDTTAFTGLATMLRREIHHRLRTNHFHVR